MLCVINGEIVDMPAQAVMAGEMIFPQQHNQNLPDGVPCGHPGCLKHISHPCEGCGRIGGRKTAQDQSAQKAEEV